MNAQNDDIDKVLDVIDNLIRNGIIKYIRVEALKLAYDTAHKIGGFRPNYSSPTSNLKDDIDDVFKLADMNIEYFLRHRKHKDI